ncbi:hypothetical protein HGA64_01925 [Candidatus Falkowbacteria bacterium]|nr:hypothetical protein [Candidatus Falkowbacteria bacterium]
MTKKAAPLSSSLVAIKGNAAAPADAVGRHSQASVLSAATSPLNFKVDAAFRRRFRQHAANKDLKLNELLREALEAWEEKNGLK